MQNGVYKMKAKHLNEVYYRLEVHNGIHRLHTFKNNKFIKQYSSDVWLLENCEVVGKLAKRAKFYDLVYMSGGKVIEKLVQNKPYVICKTTRDKKNLDGTHKRGFLLIIENNTALPV